MRAFAITATVTYRTPAGMATEVVTERVEAATEPAACAEFQRMHRRALDVDIHAIVSLGTEPATAGALTARLALAGSAR